jgi:hypothetical protein
MKKLYIVFIIAFFQLPIRLTANTIQIVNCKTEIGLYEPLFIDFTLDSKFNNPFDQFDIMVDAIIAGPSGENTVLPSFFLSQDGNISKWQARFTPRSTGNFNLKIKVSQNGQEFFSEIKTVSVKPSTEKGLLSFDKANPYFLKFDNGEKYRGVGLNVGWANEPKWETREKYSFTGLFNAMQENQANFYRMWICPWNFPIEWTPVPKNEMLTEEFLNWNNVLEHSSGLRLSEGTTAVTQADIGQLVKTSDTDENIVYKLDAVKAVKLMIYYKGTINKDDIEVLYSEDNKNYSKVVTELSDSWESTEGWRRIFIFSFGAIPQPANYIKIVFKSNLVKDNYKFSGIQFRYGKELGRLDSDGLSRFSLRNSQKLDSLFELSLSKGLYVMLTLGYHGQFNPVMDSWGVNDEWQRNPYNVKNGGPCQKPADFFSNETAKKHYKNYLRYFVARWGYSPAIVSWEFWNEIDIAMRSHKVPEADIVGWHKEMSDYLNSVDPYKHIITTSLSGGDMPELWKLENIQLTQVHRYQPSKDFVKITQDFINKYNKPHIIGEYAISWKGPGNDFPNEVYEEEFHDGLWRGLFTPVALLPMSWWWDHHYDRKEYFHFKPLATVIEEMKLQQSPFYLFNIEKIADFDILGLKSEKLMVIWVKRLGAIDKLKLSIPVEKVGGYQLTRLNTRTNVKTDLGKVISVNKMISIASIDLVDDKDAVFLISPL